MKEFVEGEVIVVGTTQAGSVVQVDGSNIWVLLNNGDIWIGPFHQCRYPQDEADLAACPIEVERFEERERKNFISKE